MNNNQNSRYRIETIEPIFRWAGGKRRLVKYLLRYIPKDIHSRTYNEPFLGAGALFFAIQPQIAILADANEHLMNCYRYIRNYPDQIYYYLKKHSFESSCSYYYKIREFYNNKKSYSAAQAARFIYLNKTCFNGIFRVNLNGKFNVPYGWKEPPFLPTITKLRRVSELLKNVKLSTKVFQESLSKANKNDFFYLDPPYPPLNGTSNFRHYIPDRFGDDDQKKLADHYRRLDSIGCKVMMSNADTSFIRNLYTNFKIIDISATRYITCKSKKHKVKELLILNYNP